ncbi:MAG: uracil phosphoribosyltransferase [Vicinamibacteraceae bacterium]|nr:uracil phosphoribosyltransferase [Vicinamibacteraceae bacterium]
MPVHLVEHPIVQDILLKLRDAATTPDVFRSMSRRISLLLAAEATRDLPTRAATIRTPLAEAAGRELAAEVVIVPVLRAGLGMLDAVLDIVPRARVGHIGLQRDEVTAVASQYYAKFPHSLEDKVVFVVDPMLATGGSAVAALDLLRRQGARDIRLLCIVTAPEGVALVEAHHPDVRIYTPVIDRNLNAQKFIVPGLGDFGDRLFGTE